MKIWSEHDDHVSKLAELIFCVLFGIVVTVDLFIIGTGHTAISAYVWDMTKDHPSLIALGMMFAVMVGWLLRRSWFLLLVWGLLMGHLFIHW